MASILLLSAGTILLLTALFARDSFISANTHLKSRPAPASVGRVALLLAGLALLLIGAAAHLHRTA